MIRPAKTAEPEFRREPAPRRHSDERIWRLGGRDVRREFEAGPAHSFTCFRPRWWRGRSIPL